MLNSIRIKLTVWYVGILALVLIAFAGLTYLLVVRVLAQEEDENLIEMARNFQTSLDSEQADEQENPSFENSVREAVSESNFHDYAFIVYDENSRRIASTTDDLKPDEVLPQANAAPDFSFVKIGRDAYRVHAVPLEFEAKSYRLFILHSLKDQRDFLKRLRSIFFAAVPLALLLSGLGGYFLARKSLAPVVEMSRRAAGIGAINLHERLPVVNEKDELGKLAQTFNNLLFRLENSFEQQRRFMADASHELRTPLAIVRGESEVTLAKDDRTAAEYRESLAVVHDESKRLTHIVEDLLTLARADAGQFKISAAEFYLDELLAECVRAVQILAKKRAVVFAVNIESEMPVRGDEQLLRQLFINLLDNAVKYNRENGTISVTAGRTEREYRVAIADSGTGISDGEKEKIFDRFYRADKARSRTAETETSGAGLGLAIAQWIAEIHRGNIELTSSDAFGSVFTVDLPFAD